MPRVDVEAIGSARARRRAQCVHETATSWERLGNVRALPNWDKARLTNIDEEGF
jgi:hypothetical protein